MSERQRPILFLTVAVVLWLAAGALMLFTEDPVFRIVGVVAFAAAVPCAIVGGRGLRDRH